MELMLLGTVTLPRIARHLRRLCVAVLAAASLAPLLGCAAFGPLPTRLRSDVVRPEPGVVLFIADGLQPDLVMRGCQEGWLPNIEKRFAQGGTRVENAVTVVPAITYAAIMSIVTGTTPDAHRIPGNRWYDPDERRFRDYVTIAHYRDVNQDAAPNVPTIYEHIDPLFSSSIQAAHTRGVTDNIANWAQSGVRWFIRDYTSVDKLTATTVDLVARRANGRRVWPALLTCYNPGIDSVGHDHGVSSPQYRVALENFDNHMGRVCNWLEREGLLESTYLALISDHGMVDVDRCVDLSGLVRDDCGRNLTDKPLQDGAFERRRKHFDSYDTVVAFQDGRNANIYFAGPSGWDEDPAPETVAEILTTPPADRQLWNVEGIDLIAYLLSEDEAAIRSSRGQARIAMRTTDRGREFRYVPVPDDPLGYLDDPALAAFVATGFHDARAWLQATQNERFPDVVPPLIPLLRERRFGNVVVFASPGYSFNAESGGHGGLHRDEMRITMMFAGPSVEAGGTLECARSVDLVPTLMTWLGATIPDDGSLAGVALVDELRSATTESTMAR